MINKQKVMPTWSKSEGTPMDERRKRQSERLPIDRVRE